MATLLLSVLGAFAEFERALIRERQAEGIALAKARGVYTGRKRALTPDQVSDLRARVAAGEPKASLARKFGISRQTLYQYLRSTQTRASRMPCISWGSFIGSVASISRRWNSWRLRSARIAARPKRCRIVA